MSQLHRPGLDGTDRRGAGAGVPVAPLVALWLVTRLIGLGVVAATREHLGLGWRRAFAPWDGPFYLDIAASGYQDHLPGTLDQARGAFFPLFPVLVRGVVQLAGTPPVATAVVLNLLLGLAGLLLFHRLSCLLLPPRQALAASLLWVCFPGQLVSTLVMSDALLATLSVATLLALVRRRWLLAGVLGMAATATRPNGVALCFAALAAAVVAWRSGERRGVVALLLTPLGVLGYWGWLGWHTGRADAWFEIQDRFWHQGLDLGWKFLLIFKNPVELAGDATYMATWAGFGLLALALWCWWRGARLPLVATVLVVVLVAQMVLFSGVGPRARFLMAAFPLLLLVAQKVRGAWLWALAALLGLAQVVLTWAVVSQYVIP